MSQILSLYLDRKAKIPLDMISKLLRIKSGSHDLFTRVRTIEEAHIVLADGWLPSKVPVVGINWVEMCISQNKFVNTLSYEYRQSDQRPLTPQRSAQVPERVETTQKPPTPFGQPTDLPLSQESSQNPSSTPFSTQFSSQASVTSPVARFDQGISNRAHSPARVTAAPINRTPTHVSHPSSSREHAPSTSTTTPTVHRSTIAYGPNANRIEALLTMKQSLEQSMAHSLKKAGGLPQNQIAPLTAPSASMLVEGSTSSEDEMDDPGYSPSASQMMDEDTFTTPVGITTSAPSRSYPHSANGQNRNSTSSLPNDSYESEMREPRPLNEASSDEEFSPRVPREKQMKARESRAHEDNEDDNWLPRFSGPSARFYSSSEENAEINSALTRGKLRNTPIAPWDTSPPRGQQAKESSVGSSSRRASSSSKSSKSKSKGESRKGERDNSDKDAEWRPCRPRPRPKTSNGSSKKRQRPDSSSPINSGDDDGGRRQDSETSSSTDDDRSSSDDEQPRRKVPKSSENNYPTGFTRREHHEGHDEQTLNPESHADHTIRIYLCNTSSSELEVESKVVSGLKFEREVVIVRNVLEASHVIVSDEDIKPTNSILRAIAGGKWVLRYKWYALLTRDRTIPNEIQFETKRWSGAKRSRIVHQARKDILEREENDGNIELARQAPKTKETDAPSFLFDSISFNIQLLSDTQRSLLIDVFASTGAAIDSKVNSIKILPDARWDFEVPHQTWHHDGKAAMPFTYITDSVLNGERLGAAEWHEKFLPM